MSVTGEGNQFWNVCWKEEGVVALYSEVIIMPSYNLKALVWTPAQVSTQPTLLLILSGWGNFGVSPLG